MPQPMPSVTEDYLKAIHAHTEWQSIPISSGALAARLGLAASTVTEMVKKLVAAGLVDHEKYGAIELTPAGTVIALTIIRRHRLIETWLVDELGYRWDEVHDEAEVLEHSMSDRILDAIDARLGHPSRDPHGDPIPSADGQVRLPAAVPLTELAAGSAGVVARVDDRDPLVLRHLAAEGIGLDTELEIVDRVVSGGGMRVLVRGTTRAADRTLDLADPAASAIRVIPV